MQQTQSDVRRQLELLRTLYRYEGVSGVLFSLFYKLANSITRFRVFRAAIFEPWGLDEALFGRLDGYRHGLCTPAELLPFVDDPEIDLTAEFLDYAAAQGDTCYAIFDGDILASYCWNSNKPTLMESDLYIDFPAGYLYRYKEYTRPSHRGRRLGSFNHAESLRHFASTGVRGFAGYVEANNYVQYRKLQRMNHLFPGFIVVIGKGPKPWIWQSPKAREWGFRLASTASETNAHSAIGAIKSR